MSEVLVVGATGLLGRAVCAKALGSGHRVRALARLGSTGVADLQLLGCEVVTGDLKDAPALERLCRGCDALIITANTMSSRRVGDTLEAVDRRGTLDLLTAAVRAGVHRVVYTSIAPEMPANNRFVAIKREVERAVRASGLTWTILQPAAFMEIHTGAPAGWDYQRGRARIAGSGRTPQAYISIVDVAAFAVGALTHPMAINCDLPLRGPDRLTARQAVEIASRVCGTTFSVQRAPLPVLRAVRAVAGPFNEHLSALLGLMIGQEEAGGDSQPRAPYEAFDIVPTLFASFVARQAGLTTLASPRR